MNRIFPIIAFIVAILVAGTAIYELNQRAADDEALETTAPSPILSPTDVPSEQPSPDETDEPTEEPEETPDGSVIAAPASPTEEPEATPTPEAPRTPSPEPELTPGRIDTSRGRSPETGADSWPAGLSIAIVALALRKRLLRY